VLATKAIGIPYKYIVPLNITFNRSLQNLSSYYTDIGYIWLVILIVILVGLCIAFIKREKPLKALLFATLAGWIFWIVVGGGILWYGIGLVAWSILAFAVLLGYLVAGVEVKLGSLKVNGAIAAVIVVIGAFGPQYMLNYIRIASQQPGSPFTWYKEAIGYSHIKPFDPQLAAQIAKKDKITPQALGVGTGDINYIQVLQYYYSQLSRTASLKKQLKQAKAELAKTKDPTKEQQLKAKVNSLQKALTTIENIKPVVGKQLLEIPYKRKTLFNLQFGHYEPFLKVANQRKPDEGIFIGGTYLRYFIDSQR